MAKFITLKLITEEVRPAFQEEIHEDHVEQAGEDDGLSNVATLHPPTEERIDWKPNTINVDTIRNFYPRKGGRPGCRVLMKTGVAYVVLDSHEEILAKISA